MHALPSLLRNFTVPAQYAGWSIEDLEMVLNIEEQVFCAKYVESGGNGRVAAQAARAIKPTNMSEYKTKKRMNQICSSKARDMLLKPTVKAYLYLKLQQIRKKSQLDESRGLEAFTRKYEEIRDLAIGEGDYSAGLKAHKELGVLYGHNVEDKDQRHRTNDIQLIAVIAGDDMGLRKQLAKQMGIDEAIEGELLPPPDK